MSSPSRLDTSLRCFTTAFPPSACEQVFHLAGLNNVDDSLVAHSALAPFKLQNTLDCNDMSKTAEGKDSTKAVDWSRKDLALLLACGMSELLSFC